MRNILHNLIIFLLSAAVSCSCSNLDSEKEATPADILLLNCNGVEYSNVRKVSSQYFLRNGSFSYFLKITGSSGNYNEITVLVSAEDDFEYDIKYPVPTPETESAWDSFGQYRKYEKITTHWTQPNKYNYLKEDVREGWVRFRSLQQTGTLTRFGEGRCAIKGDYELVTENNTILKGTFDIADSQYWDIRVME